MFRVGGMAPPLAAAWSPVATFISDFLPVGEKGRISRPDP